MNKQTEELASLYILDLLDSDERAAFETRLLRDPGLAELVEQLEPALERGVRDLPQRRPPPQTLDRIESRIASLRDAETHFETRRKAPWFAWLPLARWGVAAVIAMSLATIAVRTLFVEPAQPVVVFVGLDANQNTYAEVPMQSKVKDRDSRFMQLALMAEGYLRKPAELPAGIARQSGDHSTYAIFDPGSRQGFIVVDRLPMIADNERYHLWVVDPGNGRVREAGMLPVDSGGQGLYSFALGPDDSIQSDHPNFFITAEQDGEEAPAKPQGRVVLGRNRI